MSNILIEFGKRISRLRNEKLISQEELANKIGLHRTYLSSVERGERNISLLNIEKISVGLGLNISELMEGLGGDKIE